MKTALIFIIVGAMTFPLTPVEAARAVRNSWASAHGLKLVLVEGSEQSCAEGNLSAERDQEGWEIQLGTGSRISVPISGAEEVRTEEIDGCRFERRERIFPRRSNVIERRSTFRDCPNRQINHETTEVITLTEGSLVHEKRIQFNDRIVVTRCRYRLAAPDEDQELMNILRPHLEQMPGLVSPKACSEH